MSTSYITVPEIKLADFWKSLPPSVREAVADNESETSRCITDGTSFFWCYDGDGVVSFSRFGFQETLDDIIAAIEEHYHVELIDEHDDRYWDGCDEEDCDEDDC